LATGVPQLVLPQFDDQADNAQAVVASGAGLSLAPEHATARTVTEYTRELLSTAGFARAAEGVAAEVAAQPTPAEIVDRLPELVVAAALPS
jgi:UDP:flavonoid glycosyltransferase YjiC (YdhE family)